jgi:hypothetical protein
MLRSTVYFALAVVGAVAPYLFFVQFFGTEGIAGNFVGALFVNGASGGFATDLLISSAVFWIFLFHEARRIGLRSPWIYVLINLLIGLSCALPLFLWARERALDRDRVVNAPAPRHPAGARA